MLSTYGYMTFYCHNPEFTLMELYQAYTDFEGMMELTESMFRYLAEQVCGTTTIN